MRVTEIMQTKVRTIESATAADAAWELMRLRGIHHLVVTDEGRVAGVLSQSDLGGKLGAPLRKNRSVADLMTKAVAVAAPETTVREAANLLRGRGISCLPVMSGSRLAGIVTTRDLLELIGRGAERPTAQAKRAILKGRGTKPRAPIVAKRLAGAKTRPAGRS